jgi:hypothetical protein
MAAAMCQRVPLVKPTSSHTHQPPEGAYLPEVPQPSKRGAIIFRCGLGGQLDSLRTASMHGRCCAAYDTKAYDLQRRHPPPAVKSTPPSPHKTAASDLASLHWDESSIASLPPFSMALRAFVPAISGSGETREG